MATTSTASSSTPSTTLSNNDTPDWKRHSCSAFVAGDEIVQVVPSFSLDQKLELLSIPQLGPLHAGVAVDMPLWLALLLQKRNLCRIVIPEWLSVDSLKEILQWEQSQESFSPNLPFYWQPLARSLLNSTTTNMESSKILIQDIATVRMDKIRNNLHSLSKQSLKDEATLPIVNISGIGALELAAIHSFVQTSFGMHLKLSRPSTTSNSSGKSAQETRKDAMASTSGGGGGDNSEEEEDDSEDDDHQKPAAAPSRLRRFR